MKKECEHEFEEFEYDGTKILVCKKCGYSKYPENTQFHVVRTKIIERSPTFTTMEKALDWMDKHVAEHPQQKHSTWTVKPTRSSLYTPQTVTRFYVSGYGDPDVGMAGAEAEVVFTDNSWEGFDEEQIKNIKAFLAELYDVEENEVHTEAENEEEEKYFLQRYKNYKKTVAEFHE